MLPSTLESIRRSTAISSPSTLELIHIGEDEVSHASFVDLERPPGRKDGKERLNNTKNNDSLILNLERILNDMVEKEKKIMMRKRCYEDGIISNSRTHRD